MSTSVLFSLLAGSIFLSFLASGICLWLMARCCRVPNVSVRRAIGATVLLAAMNVGLGIPALWLTGSLLSSHLLIQVLLVIGTVGLELFLGFLIVRRTLRTTSGRALLVFVTSSVLSYMVAYSGAFAIRATMEETFVSPTGSQALSIYGNHFELKCSNCGQRFAVGVAYDDTGPAGEVMAVCPNCGQVSPLNRGAEALKGDRFIVDKTGAPNRWDIIAFKVPEQHTSYVKRLVGLPGETVAISHGHVFIDSVRLQRDPNSETDLWIPVNATQFVAAQQVPDWPHWAAADGSHWISSAGKWSCDAMKSDGEALQLQGTITDWLAYNAEFNDRFPKPDPTGDIKLECSIDSFSGDGDFEIDWAFAGRKFAVTIASDGSVKLKASADGNVSDAPATTGKLAKPISAAQRLAVAVRDGRGYLSENDRVVASVPIDDDKFKAESEQDIDAGKDVAGCKISISARHCNVDLSRIALFRDVYYRSKIEMRGPGTVPEPVKLGADEFYVLGDNSALSNDSRTSGPIKVDALIGVARWIYWPTQRWHAFQ